MKINKFEKYLKKRKSKVMPRSRSRSKKYMIRRHKAKEYLCQISQRNGRRQCKYNERRKIKLLKKGNFDLEYFMQSNDHGIARKICSYLDFEELKILREVSSTFYGFLNSEKSFWIRFMYHKNYEARKYLQMVSEAFKKPLQMGSFTLKEIGKWITLLGCILENAEVNDIITVISIIRKVFGQFDDFPPLSPLKIGVNLKSIRLLRVLEKFDLLDREELVEIYPKKIIEFAVKWLDSSVFTQCEDDISKRESEYMAPILLREKALKWSQCCLEVSHLLFL